MPVPLAATVSSWRRAIKSSARARIRLGGGRPGKGGSLAAVGCCGPGVVSNSCRGAVVASPRGNGDPLPVRNGKRRRGLVLTASGRAKRLMHEHQKPYGPLFLPESTSADNIPQPPTISTLQSTLGGSTCGDECLVSLLWAGRTKTCRDEATTTVAEWRTPTTEGRASLASVVRLLFVAYRARAGLASTGTPHEGNCEGQATDRRQHSLWQRLEPAGEGSPPERGPPCKGEGHGRILASRAQCEHHRAEKDGPDPHGPLDAFGERQRGCCHDEDRCERTVQTTAGRSTSRKPRSGSQIRPRRDGRERFHHGVTTMWEPGEQDLKAETIMIAVSHA